MTFARHVQDQVSSALTESVARPAFAKAAAWQAELMESSAARQVGGSKHQPLDPPAAPERFNDLGDVRQRDPAIKEMIGLDQDANATGTLVEAARRAGARLQFRQPARGQVFFQGLAHLFRTFVRA
jgi:hypothetical protein